MSIHNQYADIPLTEAELASLFEQFDAIRVFMEALPEVDSLIMRHVAKMGPATEGFSREVFLLAAKNEHLLPRGLDLEALEELFKKRDELHRCYVQARTMTKHLQGLLKLMGSDLFSAALAAYKAMKTNDRSGTLAPVLKELGKTFSRSKARRKKKEDGEEAMTARAVEPPAERGTGASEAAKETVARSSRPPGLPPRAAEGRSGAATSVQMPDLPPRAAQGRLGEGVPQIEAPTARQKTAQGIALGKEQGAISPEGARDRNAESANSYAVSGLVPLD